LLASLHGEIIPETTTAAVEDHPLEPTAAKSAAAGEEKVIFSFCVAVAIVVGDIVYVVRNWTLKFSRK